MEKTEWTHVIDEAGGVLGSLEERRVAGVFEVPSVLLKGGFVESLLLKKMELQLGAHVAQQCLPLECSRS